MSSGVVVERNNDCLYVKVHACPYWPCLKQCLCCPGPTKMCDAPSHTRVHPGVVNVLDSSSLHSIACAPLLMVIASRSVTGGASLKARVWC